MNTTNWFDSRLTARWRAWDRARIRARIAGTSTGVDEAPLRAQLFTAEEMEQHGRHLAATHELTRRRSRDRLLPRLGDNEKVLADTCALLAQSADGATSLKARTLALWVAENRLARAQLADPSPAAGLTNGDETQAGVTFAWRQTVSATPNPAFRKIDIVVTDPAQPDYALARLGGYVGNHGRR